MSYNYATLTTALAAVLAVPVTDADFQSLLPTIIDDAEQICYRELNLILTQVTVNGTAASNNRYFTLPTSAGHLLVIDQINIFDAASVRHPVAPASRDLIDFTYPSDMANNSTDMPIWFARVEDDKLLFGPPPGASYTVEVIGTFRPAALSATNTSTFLTTYLSDLFLAACVVSATGNLLKQWSAVADDPQMPVTWMTMFSAKLASAQKEELRKIYIGSV